MRRAPGIARSVTAVGFIAVRWMAAVCNVPALCGWLSASSTVLAGFHVVAFLASPADLGSPVLGRRGARLLATTCALNLAGAGLDAVRPEWFARAVVNEALDLLAWAWALYGVLAVARRLAGEGSGRPAGRASAIGLRHVSVSICIVSVLGLQVAALFKDRPTLWPFIDYPLYSAAQTTAVRAVHYRLYGVPAHGSPPHVEITADALGMSWFVYHTQLVPRLFDRPWLVSEQLRRALQDADLPPLRRLESERTTYVLGDGGVTAFPERRPVRFALTAGAPATPEGQRAVAAPGSPR